MFLDHVYLALRQIRARWLESGIVALGIALGTGMTVSISGIVTSYLEERAKAAGAPELRELWAESSLSSYSGDSAVTRIGTTATPEVRFPVSIISEAKAACPLVPYAYLGVTQMLEVEGPVLRQIRLRATTEDYFGACGLRVVQGSVFSATDLEHGRRVIVLGSGLARQLLADGTAGARVGEEIRLDGTSFTTIGVLAPDPDPDQNGSWGRNNVAYLPLTAAPVSPRRDWGRVTFSVEKAAHLPEALRQLEEYFDARYGTGAVTVGAAASYLWDLERRMAPLISMVSIMASLSLLISGVNGTNIMLVQVVRRTRALGIARAIGASRGSLFFQVAAEAILLGAGGGSAGAACALALQRLVKGLLSSGGLPGAGSEGLPASVAIPACLCLSLLMGLLLGLYPAIRAGLTRSADVLRED